MVKTLIIEIKRIRTIKTRVTMMMMMMRGRRKMTTTMTFIIFQVART